MEPHLPGQSGQWGGVVKDNRSFINAVFESCAQERLGATTLPPPPRAREMGDSASAIHPLARQPIWESLLKIRIDEPDFEWLMIDASHCEVHPYAAEARNENQGVGKTNRDSTVKHIWPLIRMAGQSAILLHLVPQRIIRNPQNLRYKSGTLLYG